MKTRSILQMILITLLTLSTGCEEYSTNEKYRRPDWLPGKLYTAVESQDNLSLFAACLQLTGLDTIINVSGSFTVFAPTNEAMENYLAENQFASVSDIPMHTLEEITEYHIIQNPWTMEQLQTLSAFGWRTGDSNNSNTYAYKRQTIFKNPVEKYWISKNNDREMIVFDSIEADGYKKVFVSSRKYVPIFYDTYMDFNGLTSEDFRYYFDRGYEPGNVYYAGAKILQSDIFAENGFVHIIDRVVDPMLNAHELLEREMPGESYRLFLEMIYSYYPVFEPNMAATNNQPEVRYGGVVDTLYDLNYSRLAFDLQQESTGPEGSNYNMTMVRHNGLFVPTDDAFSEFIDGILTVKSGFPHWTDIQSLPRDVSDIIVRPHLASVPIYPSTPQYQQIFREGGAAGQNEGDIIRKEFGSNCTFIGLDGYQPDPVFTSVTGPVFLRSYYSLFRLALLYCDIEYDLATYDGELCFFPIPDFALVSDSSLMLNWTDYEQYRYNFMEFNRSTESITPLSSRTLSSRILNQVGTSLPDGSANKEFIRTMGGQYIIWDHASNTVRGPRPSTIGYNGDVVKTCTPALLNEPSENGEAWSVRYWFNAGELNMRAVLSQYPEFFSLLLKADLFDPYSATTSFLDRNENYTVFVPSDEALISYGADTLSTEALAGFLKYHFLQGAIIFTDNKQPSGSYMTTAGSGLNIRTGPDLIEILDQTGNPYVIIPEQEETTNIMVTERSSITSVVHEIDQVLLRD
ncbi:MAG: fasciclin domain-containing protein [Bacteroidales bacterium]